MQEKFVNQALGKLSITVQTNEPATHFAALGFGEMSLDYRTLGFASELILALAQLPSIRDDTIPQKFVSAMRTNQIAWRPSHMSDSTNIFAEITFIDAFNFLGTFKDASAVIENAFRALHRELQEKLNLISLEDNSLQI